MDSDLLSSEETRKVFQRINSKFKQYWKSLFLLISIYITCYLFWVLVLSKGVQDILKGKDWGKQRWMLLSVAITQGLLFSLDGFVTSLLKSPFNQMCYAINTTNAISDKQKDYIVTKATESNEHCKETLKKFGILTISGEIIRVFIKGMSAGDTDLGKYWCLINISYLIPLTFASIDIILINKRLIKIKKELIP